MVELLVVYTIRRQFILHKDKSILKSRFFLKLFGIPAICWIIFFLAIMLIPDDPGDEVLTWFDFLEVNLAIVGLWFIISFIIALIINKIKKPKPDAQPNLTRNYNDTCLYTCENILNVDEYKKMVHYFPQTYWTFVIRGTILNIILTLIIANAFSLSVGALIFFAAYQIFIMLLYKVRLEHYAEKAYNFSMKNENKDIRFHTEFYDTFLIIQNERQAKEVYYSIIEICIETETHFYLKFGSKNILSISKAACDSGLINFIRDKFSNSRIYMNANPDNTDSKQYRHTYFIKGFMLLLFILTLFSLFAASWSLTFVNTILPQHGFNTSKNTWVFWCWLPIPILSIVLGFKYNHAGFKCLKNIVAGFVIGFLLAVYGSFCLFPTFSADYQQINAYEPYIDANLPENGELEIQDWGTYFDDDKTDYVIVNAYYDRENVETLMNSIETSKNWILSTQIKSELKILLPSQFHADNQIYYSVYNKTTNEYNQIPNKTGEYEIYAMYYDAANKQLSIHIYKYSYIS